MAKNVLGLERILRDADKVNCKIALWGWLGPSRYTDSELMFTDCAKLIQALNHKLATSVRRVTTRSNMPVEQLTYAQIDRFDSPCPRHCFSGMPPRRRGPKDTPAKLAKRMSRRWRVVLIRSKGQLLGYVDAADAQGAETAAGAMPASKN
jgi:hypothetical protein